MWYLFVTISSGCCFFFSSSDDSSETRDDDAEVKVHICLLISIIIKMVVKLVLKLRCTDSMTVLFDALELEDFLVLWSVA